MASMRVLIMAAGTGGHVFPALAIARRLEEEGARIDWLGTPNGMENQLLEGTEFKLHSIAVKGLKGKGLARLCAAPWMLSVALAESVGVIRRVQPDLVLGMGGYVSGPGGIAAKLLGRPLVLHEQNAVAGLTNRLLARIADRVLEAFPGTFRGAANVRYVGNPVRQDIETLGRELPQLSSPANPLRVLVIGGSQGAAVLNNAVPQALTLLRQSRPEVAITIRHQAGAAQLDDAQAHYKHLSALDNPPEVSAFIHDMAAAYAWADLVICRSGASTVSELAVAGLPALLVPYPYHKDQQQLHNARWLEQAGAARVIEQSAFDAETLAAHLLTLAADREQLLRMAVAGHSCAPRGVDAAIAGQLLEIANAS